MSFQSLLESALHSTLELDPGARDRFAFLNGRVIAVEISGTGKTIYVTGVNNTIRVLDKFDGDAETVLRGTPFALARLAMVHNSTALLMSGNVQMEGDLKLGRQLKQILASLDIDWEEQLSKRIGDVAAHKLLLLQRNVSSWAKRSRRVITQDIGEFIQEEKRLSPSRPEHEHWLRQVDDLRLGADRLAARIERLINARGSTQ